MSFGNFNYNQDTYLAQIARGNIEGAEVFQAFGSTSTAGGSDLLIFPNGIYTFSYPEQTTGETVTFVSTDDEDAVGGTGISKIHVHYLDADLNEQFAIITLTGTTPVTGQLSGVRFIQCMHVYDEDSVGTDLAAAGDILAYRADAVTPEDEVFSIILATDTRCSSSMRMVPKDKVLMLYGAAASSVSTTADAYSNIRIFATEFGHQKYNTKFIKMPIASLGMQNGNATYNFPVPTEFSEGTVIGGKFDANRPCIITLILFGTIENAGV